MPGPNIGGGSKGSLNAQQDLVTKLRIYLESQIVPAVDSPYSPRELTQILYRQISGQEESACRDNDLPPQRSLPVEKR